jgi:hypothetical protein
VTPDTVHRVAQELRSLRALLTADLKWALSQPPSDMRKSFEHRIEFWREILNEAERRIAAGQFRAVPRRDTGQSQGQGY